MGKAAQAREINDTLRYTMWSVFRLRDVLGDDADRAAEASDLAGFVEALAEEDVVVRGLYDLSGVRAEADLMIWWHAERIEQLQQAYNAFRRTLLGRRMEPFWSNAALHRPAEFNKGHVPEFMTGSAAKNYVCVYPFVRSYDWYVLDDADRRRMLMEHGMQGRDYPDVRANTVASFALGDYEWILAFEADELHRIVDLMRHLRASEARLHVREEIPFFTGPRISPEDLLARLP